jgi:hypothetical protein
MNVTARNIEVDPGDVGPGRSVLVALVQEVPPIVVVQAGAAGIVGEHDVSVLIRLGQRAVAQQSVFGDDAAWILQQVRALREQTGAVVRINQRARRRRALEVGRRDAVFDDSDAIGRPGRRCENGSESSKTQSAGKAHSDCLQKCWKKYCDAQAVESRAPVLFQACVTMTRMNCNGALKLI